MDGIHDLGGKEGFGAVVREADEPVFHARWEGRVFGLNLAGARRRGTKHRSLPARHRTDRSGRLPDARLLRALARRHSRRSSSKRACSTRATITQRAIELGASPDDRIASQPSDIPDRVDYEPSEHRQPAARRCGCAFPGRRSRANAQPRHARTHALARLRARKTRRGRCAARRLGVSRYAMRTGAAKIPNTSTRSRSTAANSGATAPNRAWSCISICSNRIWRRADD